MRVSKELLIAYGSKSFSQKHCFHRVTDTCFTNETDWISESKIGDISCRSLVWDVVLGDFQPERTGPCLVLSEVFGIRPTSGWRTLPGGSTCIFFSQRDLEFPKKFKMFINFPFQEII